MRFLCVKRKARADIYGELYDLKPLDPQLQNIEDILVTDGFSATELLSRHPDFLVEVSFDVGKFKGFPRLINRVEDLQPGAKVLIMRNGGIGDHILFLPALRVFRERFPRDCEMWLTCQKEKHPIYKGNAAINRLCSLPLRLNVLLEADCLIDFSSRNDWADLNTMHMTDAYLNFLKIDFGITKTAPQLYGGQERSPGIRSLFRNLRAEHPGRPLILLNWRASNRLRDVPPNKVLFAANRFPDALFVIAQSREFSGDVSNILKNYGENLFDCTPHIRSLDDYITAIACCDAVVSTDTGACHLSEALGKPSLILYGPTLDHLWIRDYKRVLPLRAEYEGKTCRSPCGLTKNTKDGCPESILLGSSFSPCLLSISEERIEKALAELLTKLN